MLRFVSLYEAQAEPKLYNNPAKRVWVNYIKESVSFMKVILYDQKLALFYSVHVIFSSISPFCLCLRAYMFNWGAPINAGIVQEECRGKLQCHLSYKCVQDIITNRAFGIHIILHKFFYSKIFNFKSFLFHYFQCMHVCFNIPNLWN